MASELRLSGTVTDLGELKILNNVVKRLAYIIMEDVVNGEGRNEKAINEGVLKVVEIINTLKGKEEVY